MKKTTNPLIFHITTFYHFGTTLFWHLARNPYIQKKFLQGGLSPLQKLDEILEDPMTTQDGIMREIDGRCNRDGDYDLEANNIKRRDW